MHLLDPGSWFFFPPQEELVFGAAARECSLALPASSCPFTCGHCPLNVTFGQNEAVIVSVDGTVEVTQSAPLGEIAPLPLPYLVAGQGALVDITVTGAGAIPPNDIRAWGYLRSLQRLDHRRKRTSGSLGESWPGAHEAFEAGIGRRFDAKYSA